MFRLSPNLQDVEWGTFTSGRLKGGLLRFRVVSHLVLGVVMCVGNVAFSQGQCHEGYGTADCPLSREVATAPIAPVFAATGWKTVALDHITFAVADARKEAAYYEALMGWTLQSDDEKQTVLAIGDWSTVIFKQDPEQRAAVVTGFCFAIEPWDAKRVAAELKKRGLDPVAENGPGGFESFHTKDPDGFDLQISNGKLTKKKAVGRPIAPAFASTGWKTVWLDHLSFQVTNYKESASFYSNLLGWKTTYDEGSQQELMIGEVGDIIVRGGNPHDPKFSKTGKREAKVDHISFGIAPWDSEAVKAALESRGLTAETDTAQGGDIRTAAYKSYHTTTPNGYDLQISFVTREKRLTLADAVKPK